MGPRVAAMVMGLVAAACLSQPARAAQGRLAVPCGAALSTRRDEPGNGARGDLVFDDAASPTISVAYMLTDHVAPKLMLRVAVLARHRPQEGGRRRSPVRPTPTFPAHAEPAVAFHRK